MQSPSMERPVIPVFNDGATTPPLMRANSSPIANLEEVKRLLLNKGWPTGLRNALIASIASSPTRYIICDSSGSMSTPDGHRISGEGANSKIIGCTRWSELTEGIRFIMNMAHVAQAPTEFRICNGGDPIMIGHSPEDDEENIPLLTDLLDGSPAGDTPLCHQIEEVIAAITWVAPELRTARKKVAVVIYTDGEATDGDIAKTIKPLHDLPVCLVIRLCTDKGRQVRYWNNAEKTLEITMDVLDDHLGESKQIMKKNKWLTYGAPLQQMREFGTMSNECDMLDEVKLSADQMRNFCAFLFGVKAQNLHHPEAEWVQFVTQINDLNDAEPQIWSPQTQELAKWIDMKQLTTMYAPIGAGGKQKECVIA